MKARAEKLDPQSGVSYVELLVVILVIAIVAGVAIVQRGSATEQFRVQNVAYGLKNSFERARFDSVKRRPEGSVNNSYVTVANASYTLGVDRNGNGTVEVGDETMNDLSGSGIGIVYYDGAVQTSGMPVSVKFNMRGEPAAALTGGSFIAPVFCVSNGSYSLTVLITAAGTVNLLQGCGGGPTFSDPTVTPITPTDLINDLVTGLGLPPIPGPSVTPPGPGGTPTPDPNPTGTPNPTPTATPDPSPSVTPDPTPTVSPNPSPTQTVTPTPTPTPTPIPPCTLSAPSSVTFPKNGSPKTFSVSFVNATGNTISVTKVSGPSNWTFSPPSVTPLGTTGNFTVTMTYASGNPGEGTGSVSITGCGSATVSVTVN